MNTQEQNDEPLTQHSDTEMACFSTRVAAALWDYLPNGATMLDLSRLPRSILARHRNFGKKSMAEVETALASVGLALSEGDVTVSIPYDVALQMSDLLRFAQALSAECRLRGRAEPSALAGSDHLRVRLATSMREAIGALWLRAE